MKFTGVRDNDHTAHGYADRRGVRVAVVRHLLVLELHGAVLVQDDLASPWGGESILTPPVVFSGESLMKYTGRME